MNHCLIYPSCIAFIDQSKSSFSSIITLIVFTKQIFYFKYLKIYISNNPELLFFFTNITSKEVWVDIEDRWDDERKIHDRSI